MALTAIFIKYAENKHRPDLRFLAWSTQSNESIKKV